MVFFRMDYVRHEVTKSPKPVKVYVPPDGTMTFISTYAVDYNKHGVQKHVASTTKEHHSLATKRDTMSQCKEHSKQYCTECWQPSQAKDNLTLPPIGKFANTVSYRDDNCLENFTSTRKNLKLKPEVKESLAFDGTTNHKPHYGTHPIQPRPPRKKYTPPFNGATTYQKDYKGLPAKVLKPIKVKADRKPYRKPFQETTEFRDKYKLWPLPRKQPRKKEHYSPPEGIIRFLSTMRADYTVKERRPLQRVRLPLHAGEREKGPIQAKSIMKEDCKTRDVVHQPHAAPVGETGKPSAPSRYQQTAKLTKRPSLCTSEPVQIMLSPEPIMEDLVYCTSNTGKQTGPCPASFGEPPVFEYIGTKAGQRLYCSISGEDTSLAQETAKKGAMSSQSQQCCERSAKNRRAHSKSPR
ncbi:hypothetical protein P4O66_000908 [Electrophorus voltai]|uniref:Stabilizer of axonemal microtubules 1 n=1 Tax=Electrophorus voltai TaxID=2609070 RepID=A0AAD9DZD6_9TELE|nr:hypothetical protein P4O66_000908 [Electrophorus voltai]